MTRFFSILALLALVSTCALAQFTTVSGTVVDPNGVPYALGTITPTLVIPSGAGSPTLNGSNYAPPIQANGLDLTGHFSFTVADNAVLLPAGTKWNFTVCSALGTVQPAFGKGSVCFTLAAPITITGSSVNISTNLNAIALALTVPFSGVSPLTTKGDVYVFGTANTRLPIGADATCLTADSTQILGLKWGTCVSPAAPGFSLQINNNAGALGSISNVAVGSQLASDGSSSTPIFQTKPFIDVRDYASAGGITRAQMGDGQAASDCWMTSGSGVLTCTGSHFVLGDIGKQITVYGAGATSGTFVQPLSTTIAGFTSSTQITLTANAANSNTQTPCTIASSPTGAVMNSTGLVTITCNANHNFSVNQEVIVSGVLDPRFNGPRTPNGGYSTFKIASTPTATTFTYQSAYALFSGTVTSGSGTANGNSERVLWGTDNTAAIQAAVDSLATTSNSSFGGGTVYFPGNPQSTSPAIYLTKGIEMLCSRIGTFSTGTCSKAYNNISIEGASRDTVTLENWDPSASCTSNLLNACSIIVLGQKANIPQNEGGPDPNARLAHIKISNLTLRQIKHPTITGEKVILDGASDDVNIFNNYIVGYSYECVVQAGGFLSRNWHVHDNNFGPCGRGGPGTSASTSAINLNSSWSEAYNNYVSASGQCIETGGHHMVFKHNWCFGTNVPEIPSDGINIGSTGAGIWDIVIDGNIVQDSISGLVMGNASGTLDRVIVTNNTFRDAPASLSGGGESNSVTYPQIETDTVIHGNSVFSGNKVISTYYTANGLYGIGVGTNGTPQLSQEHWTISNNVLSSQRNFAGQQGIFLVFSSNSPKGWMPATACTSTGITPTILMPTVPNGFYYRCTTGGTSGATEPTWCTTASCTVTDNTAVYTFAGSMPITTIANLRFDLPAGGGSNATDIAWDNSNMESAVFTDITANYVWSNEFRTPWLGGVAISAGSPGGAVMDTPSVNSLFGTKYHYASAVPKTQKWSLGDLVWSTSPTSGYAGWIVTTAGYATDTWAATQAYNFNYYLQPTPANGHFYREIVSPTCTSGGSQPAFPTGAGATVSDNTCTWKESGASAVFSAVAPTSVDSAGSSYSININGTVGQTTPGIGSFTTLTGTTFKTTTNCGQSGTAANPSVVACGAAASGAVACDVAASAGTCVVNTTAVGTNSRIIVQETSAENSSLGVTCNTSPTVLPAIQVPSKSAGVSFTINMPTITTNPACFDYWIVNQ